MFLIEIAQFVSFKLKRILIKKAKFNTYINEFFTENRKKFDFTTVNEIKCKCECFMF